MTMATKHDIMMTYIERPLAINSHKHLVSSFWEITCQTKNIISPLPQFLWLQNLARK